MKFNYRDDTSSAYGEKRVWLDSWSGDQFEILTEGEFNDLIVLCGRFGFVLKDCTDEPANRTG